MGLLAVLSLLVAAAPPPAPASEPDELDDILGGFDDDESGFDTSREPAEESPPSPSRWDRFDLTGSVSLGSSINIRKHRPPSRDPLPGNPQYRGLSRLRTKLSLQLDIDLARDWDARLAGYAFYDAAYRIRGRRDYDNEVLDEYEVDFDATEVWIQGSPLENLDVKLGRQIVNWGRSDTLRVVDVVNPLDNREPGLIDIEDLRRPVGAARVDYYWGSWNLSALVIPELRFDDDPVYGNDFYPSPVPIPSDRPTHWGGTPEFGFALNGFFTGWDLSFYGGRFMDNAAVVEYETLVIPMPPPADPIVVLMPFLRHDRFWMAGAGGNYAFGSWLVKGELAYFDDIEANIAADNLNPAFYPEGSPNQFPATTSRVDVMGGVEYYGFEETTIALEVVNRHIVDFADEVPGDYGRNSVETALRYTADFFNARLHVTALGIAFGEKAQDGSVVRLEANYDLRDALVVGGGILLFQKGDPELINQFARNDRLFLQIKYSF
jgi:hypothetical protein